MSMVCFAEALEMDDFPLSQKLDRVPHIGIVSEAQNVVVGHAGLLLRAEIFVKIGDGVPGNGERIGVKGSAGRRHRVNSRCVIHKIVVKPSRLDLLRRHVPGQLVDNGANHFQVTQLLGAYIGENRLQLGQRHGVALAEIAQGGADFPMGAAVLADNHLSQPGIGVLDVNGILQTLFIDKHSVPLLFPGPWIADPRPAAGVLGGLPQRAELLLVLFPQPFRPGLIFLQAAGSLFVVGMGVQKQVQLPNGEPGGVITFPHQLLFVQRGSPLLPVKGLSSTGNSVPASNARSME